MEKLLLHVLIFSQKHHVTSEECFQSPSGTLPMAKLSARVSVRSESIDQVEFTCLHHSW